MKVRSLLLCGILAWTTPLFADRIILKTGKVIDNVTVVRMTGTRVVYRSARGRALRYISYARLANVKYGPRKPSTAYLKQKRRMRKLRRKRVPAKQTDPLTALEKRLNDLEKRQRDKEAALKWSIETIRARGKRLAAQLAEKRTMENKGITPPEQMNVEIREARTRINKLFQVRQGHEKELKKLREEERKLGRQLFTLIERIEKRIGPLRKKPVKNTNPAPPPHTNAWSAMWRSALVPGWGQFHENETRKGAGLLGAHLLAAVFVLNERRIYRSARNDRKDTRLLGAAAYSTSMQPLAVSAFLVRDDAQWRMDRARGRHNKALLLLGAVYAYNLIDIAFLNGGLRAGIDPAAGGGFLTFQWNF